MIAILLGDLKEFRSLDRDRAVQRSRPRNVSASAIEDLGLGDLAKVCEASGNGPGVESALALEAWRRGAHLLSSTLNAPGLVGPCARWCLTLGPERRIFNSTIDHRERSV